MKKEKHTKRNLEKYSDEKLIDLIEDNILKSYIGFFSENAKGLHNEMTDMLFKEAIRRIKKYKSSANNYRRKYYESEKSSSMKYSVEQIRNIKWK